MDKLNINTIIKLFLFWFCFIPVPILNGFFRGLVLIPLFGDTIGRQISTIILALLFVLLSFAFLKKYIKNLKKSNLLMVGALWVILTLSFEFSFGYFVEKLTFDEMLSDFNILNGRIWLLFLITQLFTPILIKEFYKNNFKTNDLE